MRRIDEYSPGTAPRGYQSGLPDALEQLRRLVTTNDAEGRAAAYQRLERDDKRAFALIEAFADQFPDPDGALAQLIGDPGYRDDEVDAVGGPGDIPIFTK